jgi:hypothetical protein
MQKTYIDGKEDVYNMPLENVRQIVKKLRLATLCEDIYDVELLKRIE